MRFDVLAMDSTGKLYNCEVQRADAGAIPRRARYNGGLIDSRELAKGTAFKELPETYIIFITENDVFHAGLPLYHVERTIQELSRSFDDGMHILYVNGTCRTDTALGKLMQDFFQPDAGKFNYRELAEMVDYYKSEEKGVAAMCEIMEQFGAKREAKGRQEGRLEGAKDNAKETALRLMKMKMPFDQIATATGLARSEVDSLARGRSA